MAYKYFDTIIINNCIYSNTVLCVTVQMYLFITVFIDNEIEGGLVL